MSIRNYTPRRNRRGGISPTAQKILGVSLGVTILAQGTQPFVHGHALKVLIIAAFYLGAFSMILHARYSYGWRYAISYVVTTLTFAFAVEQLGVKTGWPFGDHTFEPSLGPKFFAVPIVIPIAWLMLAHPILVVSRKVTQHWVFLYGGVFFMAWHLFIDPPLASQVHWATSSSHLAFEREIPTSVPAGWLFVGMLLVAALHVSLPRERRRKGAEFVVIDIFLAWTLLAAVFNNILMYDKLALALIAGTIYLATLLPYIYARWLGQPDI